MVMRSATRITIMLRHAAYQTVAARNPGILDSAGKR